MFLPPRHVVVDDNPRHLTAILNAFQELGAPCLGLTYKPDENLDSIHFRGVRTLFLDLHLIDQVATTDDKQRFAHIAQILEDNISMDGGPYTLVVWTEHEAEIDSLSTYLNHPDSLQPHARPLAISGLPKSRFINLDTGESQRVEQLRATVMATIGEKPALAVLGAWEQDVSGAVGATLATLTELVPEEHRNTESFARGLGDVLGRLAGAAVGHPHVPEDPRAALAAALAPILADRIVNQNRTTPDTETWERAVRAPARGATTTPEQAGKINRMLHLAVPGSQTILATDWGAVVELPFAPDDAELRRRFGVGRGELLGEEFKIGRSDRDRCRLRLVRVGAACDHAQNRRGPIPYLFGVEIASGIERKKDSGVLRIPASEWSSPWLTIDADQEPFVLAVNSRYSVSVPRDDAGQWRPAYRLREQLLMQLIDHANSYLARPGVIQL